ncbi:MAG TPA: hypothetical protein VF075_00815 [Pyrinomonadaceae bacterium]
MNLSLMNRFIAIAILLLSLLPASSVRAVAQTRTNPAGKELPVRELLKIPGKLVSEAKSARPTDDLKLTGYRVEEIQLPRSLTVEIQGRQVAVDKAWRVTVHGGPFHVRAMPAVVWIDDQIVGYGIENEQLSQITAITFDTSLIHEGGVISLSYSEDKESRVRLSPRLQFKREGGNQ